MTCRLSVRCISAPTDATTVNAFSPSHPLMFDSTRNRCCTVSVSESRRSNGRISDSAKCSNPMSSPHHATSCSCSLRASSGRGATTSIGAPTSRRSVASVNAAALAGASTVSRRELPRIPSRSRQYSGTPSRSSRNTPSVIESHPCSKCPYVRSTHSKASPTTGRSGKPSHILSLEPGNFLGKLP